MHAACGHGSQKHAPSILARTTNGKVANFVHKFSPRAGLIRRTAGVRPLGSLLRPGSSVDQARCCLQHIAFGMQRDRGGRAARGPYSVQDDDEESHSRCDTQQHTTPLLGGPGNGGKRGTSKRSGRYADPHWLVRSAVNAALSLTAWAAG